MSGDPLLSATGVSVKAGERTILADAHLSAKAGELVAVVGPNGAGKTTLLRAVAGLVPASGEVLVGGRPLGRLGLRDRARAIGYLPQGHVFHWPMPVADIVALGRLARDAGADLSDGDRAAVRRAMAATGIEAFAGRAVTTLSGGERARVALARVLATEAPVILADEPTASLDPRYQLVVLDILREHARQGAVVAVLHDLGLASRYADRVVMLAAGRIVAEGPPSEVFSESRLSEVFGVRIELVERHGTIIVVPWAALPGG